MNNDIICPNEKCKKLLLKRNNVINRQIKTNVYQNPVNISTELVKDDYMNGCDIIFECPECGKRVHVKEPFDQDTIFERQLELDKLPMSERYRPSVIIHRYGTYEELN